MGTQSTWGRERERVKVVFFNIYNDNKI